MRSCFQDEFYFLYIHCVADIFYHVQTIYFVFFLYPTPQNWRSIWSTAIILAQKMWDDKPIKTSSFSDILQPISKKQLRDFEAKVLNSLSFATCKLHTIHSDYDIAITNICFILLILFLFNTFLFDYTIINIRFSILLILLFYYP